jgi:curved DNA-binding protein CbpA
VRTIGKPMNEEATGDYYETLQVSPNADADLIGRVYRLLAQRFHPDNAETGNASRFREVHKAYMVLSDPESRAKYDATYARLKKERWRLISAGAQSEGDFEAERALRLTILEVLYTRRRTDPRNPGLFPVELEEISGRPQEHLEFTMWFLIQKGLLSRSDNSRIVITAVGCEYLEEHYQANASQRRLRLEAARH